MTPPGIDPGTVRLVAQRLNHYPNPGLRTGKLGMGNACRYIKSSVVICDILAADYRLYYNGIFYVAIKAPFAEMKGGK